METTRITLPKITLIGKCGSSKDGKDFVRDLWTELNKNFSEISYLAKWDESGALKGLWGAMSDESLSFKPRGKADTKTDFILRVSKPSTTPSRQAAGQNG